jgi:hypothetical protein
VYRCSLEKGNKKKSQGREPLPLTFSQKTDILRAHFLSIIGEVCLETADCIFIYFQETSKKGTYGSKKDTSKKEGDRL